MTQRRTSPPTLEGFTYLDVLGQGGYADVFLYEQHMPRRKVAVKVLLPEAMSTSSEQFAEEANTMAAVSDHPYIVTIYQAGISGDGRAYLVMEYYPNPNYSVRARSETIPVAEVLRVGVQVASAVETAHRAGILHRDIKPANVLTSALLRPGLTDFGIAQQGGSSTVAEGLSIPWAPPEVVSGLTSGSHQADVYSLAATLYTLLAGRSPFEVPGGSNRAADLVARIERAAPMPTGRADVPASLERLLRQSLDKDPAARPASAAAFARSLQAIEQEFGPGFTPLDVLDEHVVARRPVDGGDDGLPTQMRAPRVIQAQQPPAFERTVTRGDGLIDAVGSRPVDPAAGVGRERVMPAQPDVERTVVPMRTEAPAEAERAARPRRTVLVLASVGVLAVVGVGAAVAMRGGGDDGGAAVTTVAAAPPQSLVRAVEVPAPTDVKVTRQGTTVTLRWSAPAAATGLRYRWRRSDPGGTDAAKLVDATEVTVEGVGATPACFTVESVDTAGRLSERASACVS